MRTMPLLSSRQFFIPAPCLQIEFEPSCRNKKKPIKNDGLVLLAETEGFEPSIQLPVYKLSRLARSTTLTSLLFYSHSNFPACSPDSYRDDHSDKSPYSQFKIPACSPDSYRDNLNNPVKLGLQK